MGSPSANIDSVLKTARAKCYKARDVFYTCVEDAGIVFSVEEIDIAVTKCRQQRKDFEAACKASWVKHFDVSHDKELRVLKTLRTNINNSEGNALGGLAGKDQK